MAVVFSTSGQRFGPPSVSGFSGRGGGEVFANAVRASASPFAISTFTRVGVAAAGIVRSVNPSCFASDTLLSPTTATAAPVRGDAGEQVARRLADLPACG